MLEIGTYQELEVLKILSFGAYLDAGEAQEILLPARYVPEGLRSGDRIRVFLYHDSEDRPIATTEKPLIVRGEIGRLRCLSKTHFGAFLDWGLPKDLFLPLSEQVGTVRVGGDYLVRAYVDEMTGRMTASQKIDKHQLAGEYPFGLRDPVDMEIDSLTDLGYKVIVNRRYLGLIHHSDVFQPLKPGDRIQGFVKNIREDRKIDLVPGRPGYEKVPEEARKIESMLHDKGGYLPYDDRSDPQEIQKVFGMSKRTFKAALGALYKAKRIQFPPEGGIQRLS